jgi:hypothetical protein
MAIIVYPKTYTTKPQQAILNTIIPRANDLVAYWPFLEGGGTDVADLVSGVLGRNRGKFTSGGTTPYWTAGKFGPCCYSSVNPNNGILTILTNTSLNQSVFSAECWVRMDSTPGSIGVAAFGKWNTTGWMFATNPSDTAIRFHTSSSIVGPNLTFGVWYHLCGTYDGTTRTFYVNGQSVGTASGFTVNTVQDMNIGTYGSLAGAVWPGAVDLCAYYSKVLTAEEVWDAYNNPLALLLPKNTFRLFGPKIINPGGGTFFRPNFDLSGIGGIGPYSQPFI